VSFGWGVLMSFWEGGRGGSEVVRRTVLRLEEGNWGSLCEVWVGGYGAVRERNR